MYRISVSADITASSPPVAVNTTYRRGYCLLEGVGCSGLRDGGRPKCFGAFCLQRPFQTKDQVKSGACTKCPNFRGFLASWGLPKVYIIACSLLASKANYQVLLGNSCRVEGWKGSEKATYQLGRVHQQKGSSGGHGPTLISPTSRAQNFRLRLVRALSE